MLAHRDAHLRFTLARASRVGYCLAFLALLASGCAQQRYITRRDQPNRFLGGPLAGPIASLTKPQPKPTPRTLQLLRRYDLVELQTKSPEIALTRLQQEIEADPNPDKICSYAELAYLDGQR